jgi:hypothetical protein
MYLWHAVRVKGATVRVGGRWCAVEKDRREFGDLSTVSVSGPMGEEQYAKELRSQFGAGSGRRENYVQKP